MIDKAQTVYIGLGSNLDSPIEQILKAFKAIQRIAHSPLVASSLYQTKPWGMTNQPDFINAVVTFQSGLSVQSLLALLLGIEKEQGRIRQEKNGPRTLDCDILLYGQEIIHEKELMVPHPGLSTRATVLVPLAEIAPNLIIPQSGPLKTLLQHSDCSGVTKLATEEIMQ